MAKSEVKDEVLVKAFQENLEDLALFEPIILRYEAKLVRYVRSLGMDLNLAEDVVQDAFIRAYRNIRSFNPDKGKWSSWLYRVTHNVAMTYFRKSKKDLTVDDNDWWEGISVPETITDEVEGKIDAQMLAACLQKIDLKYREPLSLYFLQNKKYDEIGDILHLPTSTVGTRIKRGRANLKTIIEAAQSKIKTPPKKVN